MVSPEEYGANPWLALIEKISILLQRRGAAPAEDENLDWGSSRGKLSRNRESCQNCFLLNAAGPPERAKRSSILWLAQALQEVLAQRRKNEEMSCRAKARELGRQITLAQAREDGGSCVHWQTSERARLLKGPGFDILFYF